MKEYLALTATEQKVILFLTASFIVGAGLKMATGVSSDSVHVDYRTSDSMFTALSAEFTRDTVSAPASETILSSPLNINTATLGELITLPGVGPVMAQRILAFRKDHGALTSLDELTAVKGISQKRLEKLRPLLRLQ